MTRSSLIIICALSCFSTNLKAQTNPAYSKNIEEKIRAVEQNLGGWVQVEGETKWTLLDRMKHYHVNGISIAVVDDFKLEWARGYGWADSGQQRPVDTRTLFQAGSISKSLNAVGVLALAQNGKLDLYADINQYLRSWKFPYDSLAKGKKISLANLLSHTAGLSVHGFPGYEKGDTIPRLAQVLDGIRPANTPAVRSQFEPSLRFQYSGGGTTISQLIVQDQTQEPYDKYMGESVLLPMGMDNSSYTQPPATDKRSQLATAYYNDGKEVKGKYHIYPEQAAAGLWTNPTDLSKYIIETQLSLLGKSSKVLDQKMTKLRLTPYVDSTAALGVFILKKGDQKYFNHNGVDEGFVALYYGSMEGGKGMVVMANTYSTSILDEIANSIATIYGWKDFYKPQQKKLVAIKDDLMASYAGKYKLNKDTFDIIREKDGLYILDGDNHMKMLFTSESNFFIYEAQGLELSFTRDAQGKLMGFDMKREKNVMKAVKIG
jgi:CubicO group peptidase (beta-lactamase class C family)